MEGPKGSKSVAKEEAGAGAGAGANASVLKRSISGAGAGAGDAAGFTGVAALFLMLTFSFDPEVLPVVALLREGALMVTSSSSSS